MNFSTIIPSFNNKEYTKKCLQSLRKEGFGLEIIVIDNGSTDGSVDYLKKQKDIILITNSVNKNFSKACNQGAKKARGEILIFLNNDTEVHSGWLKEIENIFLEEINIGAVGVKLLFPNGKIQHAGVVISEDKIPRHIYSYEKSNLISANKKRYYTAVTAACIAIPKKIFSEVDGFDELYVNGLEDIDLCLKIKKAGYDIIYTPKSVVTHYESISEGRFQLNKSNSDLYMSRWKNIEPDEHKFYKEDGFGWFYVKFMDLKHMAYSKNEYKTVPSWIKYAKFVYIPLQKINVFFKLLLEGDFKKISSKLLGGKNEG